MSDADPQQRVVPADNGDNEPVSAIVEPAVPADDHSGSPEPVEWPRLHEALVEALEAELCLEYKMKRLFRSTMTDTEFAESVERIKTLEMRVAAERRRASTGGNDQALRSAPIADVERRKDSKL